MPNINKYGFKKPERNVYKSQKGLNSEVVEEITKRKNEPAWMREFRFKSLAQFVRKPLPVWGGDLTGINFHDIYYYLRPIDEKARSWDDLPVEIKDTYDRIGIPQAEKKFLAGVSAQWESEVVYKSIQETLRKKGVIFLDMDSGLEEHPDIVRRYFGTVIPPGDNKFAALNSSVWSGGSFVYIPKGVRVDLPLQAYFRINAANMGQFERTLIIAEEGSFVHYVEGCFTKDIIISVESGYKRIEEVCVGDRVLTHTGAYKSVYQTQKRSYQGMLYTIAFYGDSSQKLKVTSEHPFLVARREKKNERNTAFSLRWQRAQELSRKDYLAMPINTIVNNPAFHVFVTHRGAGRHIHKQIKRAVKLSPEFFRLVGYYLAEGSISSNSYVNFSFSIHERDYIEDIKRLVRKVFGISSFHESIHKKNHGISLVICSVELARIFVHFGTSSDTKHLPSWMMSIDPEKQKEIIIGWFRGDGNYYSKKNTSGYKEMFRINTVSSLLVRQGRDILLRLKIVAIINKRMRAKEGRKTMYTLGIGGEFMVAFGRIVGIPVMNTIHGHKRATLFAIDGHYAYVPIKSIIKRYVQRISVYNFSVKKDESYVALGVAVHNCTAPVYTTDSLHSAVVEIIVKKGARVRYTTIQNWSTNVYNLVTKRAQVDEEGTMEWIDGNIGSRLSMKYPSVHLVGPKARGEMLSIAYAGKNQHQDVGAKAVHLAPETTSQIISKSVSRGGGRTSYRGLVYVAPQAVNSRSKVVCDALILDDASRSDTYPTMNIDNSDVTIEHEASVSKIGDDQLFYLTSRGIDKAQAESMIVNGFIEPIVKELPLEYAVELNRLIQLQMEGSVG